MSESFHFLHPQWLWLLLPLGLLLLRLRMRADDANPWRRVLEPGLQPLLLGADAAGHRPARRGWVLLAAGWLLAVLALANPVWERAPGPVYETQSARVVVLDLSLSMLTRDLAPDRLTRMRFKVEDILRLTDEGQVGLVVFAVDAFTVTPLTRDAATLRSQLRALEPDIMPVQGSRADLGLRQAGQLLHQSGVKEGQVLLLADGVEGNGAVTAAAELRQQGYRVAVLGIGTAEGAPLTNREGRWVYAPDGKVIVPKLEQKKLQQIAAEGGGRYATISDDDSDVRALLAVGLSAASEARASDQAEAPRWKERGPWLVLLLLPLAALAFRRGWLFSVVLCVVVVTPPEPVLAAPDATANGRTANLWERLWQTREQLADRALRDGDLEGAAALSQAPLRRGAAHYRQGDYAAALADFEQGQGAQASYNRGNALARLGRYQEAHAAYEDALAAQPDMQDAVANKKAVEDLLERMRQQQEQSHPQQDPRQAPQAQRNEDASPDQAEAQPGQQQGQSSQPSVETDQSPGQSQAPQDRTGREAQDPKPGQGQDGETRAAEESGEESGGKTDRDEAADGSEQDADAQSTQAQAQAGAGQQQDQGQPEKNGAEKGEPEETGAGGERDSAPAQADPEGAEEEQRNVFAEALDEMARPQEADEVAQGRPAGPAVTQEDNAPSVQAPARSEALSSEEQLAAEQWLRRIPDDPGGLLRRKFQYQYQQRRRALDSAATQGW